MFNIEQNGVFVLFGGADVDTRGIIINAMEQLLSKKHFDKITVQDILDKAKIARATFYRYFPDKYAVMNSYYGQLIHGISTDSSLSTEDKIRKTLSIVLENKESFAGVVDVTGVNSFKNFVFSCALSFYLDCYREKNGLLPDAPVPEEAQMIAEFLAGGCLCHIDKWIIKNDNISTEALFNCIYKTMPADFI